MLKIQNVNNEYKQSCARNKNHETSVRVNDALPQCISICAPYGTRIFLFDVR
jgi:hypothetical protein